SSTRGFYLNWESSARLPSNFGVLPSQRWRIRKPTNYWRTRRKPWVRKKQNRRGVCTSSHCGLPLRGNSASELRASCVRWHAHNRVSQNRTTPATSVLRLPGRFTFAGRFLFRYDTPGFENNEKIGGLRVQLRHQDSC